MLGSQLLHGRGAFFRNEQNKLYGSQLAEPAPDPQETSQKYFLLESIIESIVNEQSGHERTHWGDEDRRSKLLFRALEPRHQPRHVLSLD